MHSYLSWIHWINSRWVFWLWKPYAFVVGVTKMGNTEPRVGIEPISLGFGAGVLPLNHGASLMLPTCLCSSLPQRSVQTATLIPWNCKSFNAYNGLKLHIHTQSRFNNHTVRGLCRIMVMATSVEGVPTMGNTVPSADIEPTYLAFQASVLPLHHMSPVYAASWLRAQCRRLHFQDWTRWLYL